jgi:hypothetical protein
MKMTTNCKVVCVNDTKPKDFKPHHFPNWVVKDKEYHIRKILYNDDIVTGVLLREIVNPILFIPLINELQEGAFATWRFEVLKTAGKVFTEKIKNETDKERSKRQHQERLNHDIHILNTNHYEVYIFE